MESDETQPRRWGQCKLAVPRLQRNDLHDIAIASSDRAQARVNGVGADEAHGEDVAGRGGERKSH
jgi:hypothetical protein